MTVAARAAIVVVAVLAAGSFAAALRPVRDEKAGLASLQGHASRADVARAYRLLARSAAHTRSTEPDLSLAQLDVFTGRPDSAVRRLEGIVRREPANLEAQALLAQAARTVDPALAERARRRVRALSPPVPMDR